MNSQDKSTRLLAIENFFYEEWKVTIEQAYQATNGRATNLQPAKNMDFGKCRLAKRLPPPQASRDKKPKIYHNFPNNFPQEINQGILKFCLYVEKTDFEGRPR